MHGNHWKSTTICLPVVSVDDFSQSVRSVQTWTNKIFEFVYRILIPQLLDHLPVWVFSSCCLNDNDRDVILSSTTTQAYCTVVVRFLSGSHCDDAEIHISHSQSNVAHFYLTMLVLRSNHQQQQQFLLFNSFRSILKDKYSPFLPRQARNHLTDRCLSGCWGMRMCLMILTTLVSLRCPADGEQWGLWDLRLQTSGMRPVRPRAADQRPAKPPIRAPLTRITEPQLWRHHWRSHRLQDASVTQCRLRHMLWQRTLH